jgi:hypothetical protein
VTPPLAQGESWLSQNEVGIGKSAVGDKFSVELSQPMGLIQVFWREGEYDSTCSLEERSSMTEEILTDVKRRNYSK